MKNLHLKFQLQVQHGQRPISSYCINLYQYDHSGCYTKYTISRHRGWKFKVFLFPN